MSDLSDVLNVLVATISAVVYPNGIAAPSIANVPIRVYAGWPIPQQLDADLKAGICHVSVYPRPEESNTTRYPWDWQQVSLQTATLTLAIVGQTIVLGGAIPLSTNPHNLCAVVNGIPAIYQALPTDSLMTATAALAAQIAITVPGTSASGAVITCPASARLGRVMVGVTGTSMRELKRQERLIQIGVWADSPTHRDAIASAIDPALAALTFIEMPDASLARLRYKSSLVSDKFENSTLFRRDLMYDVEYGTNETLTVAQIVAVKETVSTPTMPTPIATVYT